MNKFSENLRARRTALGLTQEALAEKLHVTRQAVSNWENGKNQPDLEMLALLSWALEADVSALLGGDAPPRSRGNLRRAVWFALALLGAALACRLPLPYLAEWYQRTYIMWPYQLYLLLLRPLLWALGGWTLIAALHAFPGIPTMAGRPRRVLFWCGLAWCLVWLLLPLLGFVLSSLPVYLSLVWILRAPWIHLPGAIAMALGALKGRQGPSRRPDAARVRAFFRPLWKYTCRAGGLSGDFGHTGGCNLGKKRG